MLSLILFFFKRKELKNRMARDDYLSIKEVMNLIIQTTDKLLQFRNSLADISI